MILISVPYAALPQIGKDFAKELKDKVVLETGNPYPSATATWQTMRVNAERA